ncbi:MAG: TOBE domain-containing protein, partial [Nitrosospira sp.]|nr:TOBE domain-containing protein [Nitrosospira sp.]
SDGITSVEDVLQVNCNPANVAHDGQASLMVRPEFIRFLGQDESAEFVVHGTLREQFELGSRIQYQVDIGNDLVLTVEKLRENQFPGEVGENVKLGWDLARAYLIHKDAS